MKIKKETTNKNGVRQLVVELTDPSAKLIEVSPETFYKLGEEHGDIVTGETMISASRAVWCQFSQSWDY